MAERGYLFTEISVHADGERQRVFGRCGRWLRMSVPTQGRVVAPRRLPSACSASKKTIRRSGRCRELFDGEYMPCLKAYQPFTLVMGMADATVRSIVRSCLGPRPSSNRTVAEHDISNNHSTMSFVIIDMVLVRWRREQTLMSRHIWLQHISYNDSHVCHNR